MKFNPFQTEITQAQQRVFAAPLKKLSKTDPSKVQEIVSSQIELLNVYHNVVLAQARRSFRWALITSVFGFCFFLAALGFLLFMGGRDIAIISVISGALIEVIAGINFNLYGKTSAQLADFEGRLDKTQRFLLANSVCEGIEGEMRQQTRADLVKIIAGSNTTAP